MHQRRLRNMEKTERPKKLTANDFRVRCSGISKIMGKLSGGLTETKKLRLDELRLKKESDPLTASQREEYNKLVSLYSEGCNGEPEPENTPEEVEEEKPTLTPSQLKKLELQSAKNEEKRLKTIENNKARLSELEAKISKGSLTDNQKDELEKLEEEKDRPFELPQGAKTYVEQWVKDNVIYKRSTQFGNKYTKKGNDVEDESIELISKYFDLGFIRKNKIRKFAEFIEGECDVELLKCIIDAKNSYTHDTFPIFEYELPNYDYWCQMQGYMDLYGKDFALVCYLLTNATEELILKECANRKWLLGLDEVNEELYNEVKRIMTYDDVNIKCRVKAFRINKDEGYIQAVKDRVVMCREYAEKIIDKFLLESKTQHLIINP